MSYKSQEIFSLHPPYTTSSIREHYITFLDKIWLPLHSTSNNLELFHYTDNQGLLGILESSELWLSHAIFLNDPTELSYGRNLIIEVIDKLIEEHIEDYKRIELFKKIKSNINHLGKITHPYIACFCESGNLLSQWREYSDSGGGYCLGFDFNNEVYISENDNDLSNETKLKLRKIIYDLEQQQLLTKSFLSKLTSSYLEDKESQNELSDEHFLEATAASSLNVLSDLIISFKHMEFEEEREWRLVRLYRDDFDLQNLNFRTSHSYIVPYRKAKILRKINGDFYFPISSIRFGPSHEYETTSISLDLLVKHLKNSNRPIKLGIVDVDGTKFKIR